MALEVNPWTWAPLPGARASWAPSHQAYGQVPAPMVAGVGGGVALLYGAATYGMWSWTRSRYVQPAWLGYWLSILFGLRTIHALGWTAVRLREYQAPTG